MQMLCRIFVLSVLLLTHFAVFAYAGQSHGSLDNTGGPDAAGYAFVDNVGGDTASFDWIELCGDGFADDGPSGDDVVTSVSWTWDFPFYGSMYSSAFVSTNGMLQFGSGNIQSGTPCPYASTTPAGPQIAPYWDDLWCITIGGCNNNSQGPWVRYRDFGTQLVIEWSQVTHFGQTTDRFTFEVILYPNGQIKFQYNTNWNDGATPNQGTIGIDAPGEGNGLEYRCHGTGSSRITGGRAILFYRQTGAIAGVVRDEQNAPLSGANVWVNELGTTFTTGSDGLFSFGNIPLSTYSVTACDFLFANNTQNNIVVTAGQTTVSNFALTSPGSHTYTSVDGPVPIHNLQTSVSHTNVLENFEIGKVWVLINSITHTYDGDLSITLISPVGTSALLSFHNGGGGDNYTNTLFDDCAACQIEDTICGVAPFTGSYRPEHPLAPMIGASSIGQWTLSVSDDDIGDEGSIDQWTLYIENVAGSGIIGQPGGSLPASFTLLPNYPNPFNPATQLGFSLPRAAEVNLSVYDLTGRRVAELANGRWEAGDHSVTFDGSQLPSGVYFARLTADHFTAARKMVLLK